MTELIKKAFLIAMVVVALIISFLTMILLAAISSWLGDKMSSFFGIS